MHETEQQIRLRRAKDALTTCREKEAEARQVLARAVESTRNAKERYQELFLAEEQAEQSRRRTEYRHATH